MFRYARIYVPVGELQFRSPFSVADNAIVLRGKRPEKVLRYLCVLHEGYSFSFRPSFIKLGSFVFAHFRGFYRVLDAFWDVFGALFRVGCFIYLLLDLFVFVHGYLMLLHLLPFGSSVGSRRGKFRSSPPAHPNSTFANCYIGWWHAAQKEELEKVG